MSSGISPYSLFSASPGAVCSSSEADGITDVFSAADLTGVASSEADGIVNVSSAAVSGAGVSSGTGFFSNIVSFGSSVHTGIS